MSTITEPVTKGKVALTVFGINTSVESVVQFSVGQSVVAGKVGRRRVRRMTVPMVVVSADVSDEVAVRVSQMSQLAVRIIDSVRETEQLSNVVHVDGVVDGEVIDGEVIVHVHYVGEVIVRVNYVGDKIVVPGGFNRHDEVMAGVLASPQWQVADPVVSN